MLNFVYWPISAILWFWHKLFSFVLDPGSGITWVLAIVFLTFTIRVLLVRPTLNQMRSSRKMQDMQPRMTEIRNKYKNDQQKMVEETRKLQKEMGVNPLAGCLPVLVQMPVFIGLFHVLRSFNRTGTGAGQLGMSIEKTAIPRTTSSPRKMCSPSWMRACSAFRFRLISPCRRKCTRASTR